MRSVKLLFLSLAFLFVIGFVSAGWPNPGHSINELLFPSAFSGTHASDCNGKFIKWSGDNNTGSWACDVVSGGSSQWETRDTGTGWSPSGQ